MPVYWGVLRKTAVYTVFCGARGGRTLTMSPSTDFKSVASADSAIAPVSEYSAIL